MAKKKMAGRQVRSTLSQYRVHAKKKIGQHFLTDENIPGIIIEAAGLKNTDTVVEVGPGLGILTERMAPMVRTLYAVEIDRVLASKLKRKLSHLDNIHIIEADILQTDLSAITGGQADYKVVANLPYYITSPILSYFVHGSLKPSSMIVMLQKEVGDSILAAGGNLSVLSISLRIHAIPSLVAYVPPQCFYPEPKVHSAILRFDFLKKPAIEVDDVEDFLHFVNRGFTSPRKYVSNSLALGLNIETVEAAGLLDKAGIETIKRPENLTLEQWKTLYDLFRSLKLSDKDRCYRGSLLCSSFAVNQFPCHIYLVCPGFYLSINSGGV
jgi:16S rRNA (adenine1518-N6/adenine1519-N6)-dimethyltransferase